MRLRLSGKWLIVSLLSMPVLIAAANDAPLVEALKEKDQATIRSLLQQQVDVNAASADGATALHWAAHLDDLKTAQLLVRAGADVNVANRYGVTPLLLACTNGNVEMVKFLLESKADPNSALPEGETALMTAAWVWCRVSSCVTEIRRRLAPRLKSKLSAGPSIFLLHGGPTGCTSGKTSLAQLAAT